MHPWTLATVIVAVLIGYARGGSLRGLREVELRAPWVPILAMVVQLSLRWWPTEQRAVPIAGTFLVVGLWIVWNLAEVGTETRLGSALLGLGLLGNAVVVIANGHMPVSVSGMQRAGMTGFVSPDGMVAKHGPITDDTVLAWLGDTIPVALAPLRSVISLGDILIWVGVVLLVATLMARTPRQGRGPVMALALVASDTDSGRLAVDH